MSKTWSSLLLGFDSLKYLFLLIVICIKIRVHYDVVGIIVTSESTWSIVGSKVHSSKNDSSIYTPSTFNCDQYANCVVMDTF